MKKQPLFPIATFAATLALPFAAWAETRTWTDVSGRKVEGELVKVSGDSILLRVDGKEFTLPKSKFSEEDQAIIKEWKPAEPGAGAGAGAEAGEWPVDVAVRLDFEIVKVKEDKEAKEFVYRSPHFEFTSDVQLSTSLVNEFSRIFEATYETVKQIPVGLDPKPAEGDYFQTRLFERKADYFEAGGPEGSAGVYMPSKRMIMIPLENLGVRDVGNRFVVDAGDSNTTLKHELTHQLMQRWLRYLPVWFTEGWAEYLEAVPYAKGRYRFTGEERAVKESALSISSAGGSQFAMIRLERLTNITYKEWIAAVAAPNGGAGANYKSSMLAVYFLTRLDGDANGTNMKNFFSALHSGLAFDAALEKFLFRGRSISEVEEAMAKAWRSEGMRIEFEGE